MGGKCSFYLQLPIKSRFLIDLNNKKQVVFDTTEMAMEDDYGMLDGVINNGKSSVLEQLKELSASENPRIPSRNHPERELE